MDYNELVESFAASLGIEGAQIEGGAVAFEIDDMKVSIVHDESAGTVMIYGEIGLPPSDDDRSFGTAMLKANHLFCGTGGATLCQDPETGTYAIFQAFPLSGLDAESLAEQMARIVDKTEHWRNILNAFQIAEREKGEAAAEEMLIDAIHGGQGGFIQV
jgi:Tir chaperone protein (CesT).